MLSVWATENKEESGERQKLEEKMRNFKTSNLQILRFHLSFTSIFTYINAENTTITVRPDRLKSPGTLLSAVNANHRGFDFFS